MAIAVWFLIFQSALRLWKIRHVQGLSFPENDVENPIWIYWNKGIEQAPIIVNIIYGEIHNENTKCVLQF